jgi:two-component system LytT family response regulator
MSRVTCVIVDDEPGGRETLINFISKYCPELELLGTAENVATGVELIQNRAPQLVFLDIEMPDGTGFNLLEKIDNINFKVIFVTAYQEFAIKAFNFSAIDYLLKPINPEQFKQAVEKAIGVARLDDISKKLEVLLSNTNKLTKIALPSATGIQFALISDIVRCESDNNYTFIHLKDGTKTLVTRTLKEYDQLLQDHGFYRTHKSHLVNLSSIKEYVRGEGGWVVLEDGSEIEVARRRKDGLLEALSFLNM